LRLRLFVHRLSDGDVLTFRRETGAILSPVFVTTRNTKNHKKEAQKKMPKIQAETATGHLETDAPAGKKLVLALEDAGVDILHRCGGNARCTTCRVEVLEGEAGEMGELERNRLAVESELAPNVRLSCQIRVENDLSVRVINQVSTRGMDAGPRPVD
jgi:ferredoxin